MLSVIRKINPFLIMIKELGIIAVCMPLVQIPAELIESRIIRYPWLVMQSQSLLPEQPGTVARLPEQHGNR
jgi:hypothetical protein